MFYFAVRYFQSRTGWTGQTCFLFWQAFLSILMSIPSTRSFKGQCIRPADGHKHWMCCALQSSPASFQTQRCGVNRVYCDDDTAFLFLLKRETSRSLWDFKNCHPIFFCFLYYIYIYMLDIVIRYITVNILVHKSLKACCQCPWDEHRSTQIDRWVDRIG